MKKYLLFVFSTLLLWSCSKKEDTKSSTAISITGLTDLTLKNDETKVLNLEVTNTEGSNEVITLSAEGLPETVSMTLTPNSGTKKFNAVLSLTAKSTAVSGDFPVKVVATLASGARKEFPITLKLDITNFNFAINGLINPTLNGIFSTSFNIEVKQTGAVQESVTLGAENLPTGVTVSFTPNSGITTFSSMVIFNCPSTVKSGVYPVKITATNAAGLKRTYTINLTIDIPCSVMFSGRFNFVETIDGVEQAPEEVVMSSAAGGIYDGKYYHMMRYDCSTKTIDLYEQGYVYGASPKRGSISGTGTFNETTITVSGTFKANDTAPVKTFKRVYTKK